jgi:hypothetical protein
VVPDFACVLHSDTDLLIASLSSTMGLEIVTIRVGEPAVDIPVYKDLICSVAPYFDGAFNKSFSEAEERLITLPNVSETTFRIFLKWCHAQLNPAHVAGPDLALDEFANDAALARGAGISDTVHDRPAVFDEDGDDRYHAHLKDMSKEKRNEQYYNNQLWMHKFDQVIFSFLRLYAFIDKYSVDQLRDDVVSSYMGY